MKPYVCMGTTNIIYLEYLFSPLRTQTIGFTAALFLFGSSRLSTALYLGFKININWTFRSFGYFFLVLCNLPRLRVTQCNIIVF